MTNPNLRHIAIVLDRSGSMQTVKTDTEGGLKAFLAEQATLPGQTLVSLYQFDDRYDVVYEGKPLADVPDFTLKPRNTTALLDAVGMTINRLGEQLAAKTEDDRPGEVILVILTDGYENCSREYSLVQVKAMVTEQREKYGWQILFLMASEDAIAVADGMGIRGDTVIAYGSDKTSATLSTAGAMVARGARSGTYAFTDDERDATRS